MLLVPPKGWILNASHGILKQEARELVIPHTNESHFASATQSPWTLLHLWPGVSY